MCFSMAFFSFFYFELFHFFLFVIYIRMNNISTHVEEKKKNISMKIKNTRKTEKLYIFFFRRVNILLYEKAWWIHYVWSVFSLCLLCIFSFFLFWIFIEPRFCLFPSFKPIRKSNPRYFCEKEKWKLTIFFKNKC